MLAPDIETQLAAIESLLQDRSFALEMARWLDSAYYRGLGLEAPPFIEPGLVTDHEQESVGIRISFFKKLNTLSDRGCHSGGPLVIYNRVYGQTRQMGQDFIGEGPEYHSNGPFPGIERCGYGPGNQVAIAERKQLFGAAKSYTAACRQDDDTGTVYFQNTGELPAGSGSVVNNR